MIFLFFVSLIMVILDSLLFFLPKVTELPFGIDSVLQTVIGIGKALADAVPILQLPATYITFIFVIESGIFVFHGVTWVLKKLHITG